MLTGIILYRSPSLIAVKITVKKNVLSAHIQYLRFSIVCGVRRGCYAVRDSKVDWIPISVL